MDLAYKRIWPGGPPEAKQDEQLRGVADLDAPGVLWRDGPVKRRQRVGDDQLPELTNATACLRDGDVLWIAFPEVLAHSDREAMARLAAITRLGGVLGVASLGRTYRWHPDAAEALEFLSARGGYADRQRTVAAREKTAAERAKEDGKFQRELRKVAQLWKNLDLTATEVAQMAKRDRSTLYRWQRQGLLPKVRADQ